MYNGIRRTGAKSASTESARLQAIEEYVPLSVVSEVLQHHQCKEIRVRKLWMSLVVYLVIAMSLFAQERLALVLGRLLVTVRWLAADDSDPSDGDAAILYRRKQLGVAPLVELFHRVCQPLAVEQTQGAFLFGLRLMAIDGKQINFYQYLRQNWRGYRRVG